MNGELENKYVNCCIVLIYGYTRIYGELLYFIGEYENLVSSQKTMYSCKDISANN